MPCSSECCPDLRARLPEPESSEPHAANNTGCPLRGKPIRSCCVSRSGHTCIGGRQVSRRPRRKPSRPPTPQWPAQPVRRTDTIHGRTLPTHGPGLMPIRNVTRWLDTRPSRNHHRGRSASVQPCGNTHSADIHSADGLTSQNLIGRMRHSKHCQLHPRRDVEGQHGGQVTERRVRI